MLFDNNPINENTDLSHFYINHQNIIYKLFLLNIVPLFRPQKFLFTPKSNYSASSKAIQAKKHFQNKHR